MNIIDELNKIDRNNKIKNIISHFFIIGLLMFGMINPSLSKAIAYAIFGYCFFNPVLTMSSGYSMGEGFLLKTFKKEGSFFILYFPVVLISSPILNLIYAFAFYFFYIIPEIEKFNQDKKLNKYEDFYHLHFDNSSFGDVRIDVLDFFDILKNKNNYSIQQKEMIEKEIKLMNELIQSGFKYNINKLVFMPLLNEKVKKETLLKRLSTCEDKLNLLPFSEIDKQWLEIKEFVKRNQNYFNESEINIMEMKNQIESLMTKENDLKKEITKNNQTENQVQEIEQKIEELVGKKQLLSHSLKEQKIKIKENVKTAIINKYQ